ncbi:MAG TPA: dihydroorotase [Spirochaetota bacterium]|nr:dihydroorotase [Spirochaetota bacterium]HOK91971.1 dihydroorotase [Spirochaetota bacterium]HON15109.1 dihydroorotase [Spirochaetota bacterium]HPD78390.1 dihydroorotase [Spirochaetota bacterium]HPP94780.1 dihydroorotase [Spirochaetota bacterium]
MKIVIKNGRVINPATGLDDKLDLVLQDGFIATIDHNIHPKDGDTVIDATGCLVLPGLIDMHVHFREPGREDVETIIGGSQIAAKSGFTSVCTMPNTKPVIDNQALVRFIIMEAAKGPINVFPAATITKGAKGEEISEMGELVKGGAVAFTDDGRPVMSSIVMRRALEYTRMFNVPILSHAEDTLLADEGLMNEGLNSTRLGLKGIPCEAEEVMVSRDILLTRLTGGRLHFCHISSAGSVELIRLAKKDGIKITCETAPHYFSITDDIIEEKMSMAKMNPPLRTEEHRKGIIEGLRDGTIDCIATDHAPHSPSEKMQEMEYAPFGIIGLETAVPLIITELVRNNNFSYIDAFSKVTCNPAAILNLDRGSIAVGAHGDITIINPDKKILIDKNFIKSRCKNTPFMGMELYGSVEYTLCNGKIVYSRV